MAEDEITLLKEIRDLLVPVASHYRPEWEEKVRREHQEKAARLAKLVRGDQARRACRLMDGKHDQRDIRSQTGITSGNLSTVISRLSEAEMLTQTSDRSAPALIFQGWELDEIFGSA